MTGMVAKEYGKLKRVLMHRPGAEFNKVTEATMGEYNFQGVPDPALFLKHYDQLTGAISERSAQVVLLTDVLKDNPTALDYIAIRPNLCYTRDLAVMSRAGMILMGMQMKSRQGDTWVIRAALERLGVPILGEIAEPGFLEGGGVAFIDETTCVASICDRTNHWGTRQFCDLVLNSGAVEQVVLVPMVAGSIHIDGAFMTVGPKTALIHLPNFAIHPARVVQKGKEIRYVPFADFLAERDFTLIEITDEEFHRAGVNIITTAPFQGVGFDSGARLFGELAKFGGAYSSVPLAELIKGCGGPHCLTCPIEREG